MKTVVLTCAAGLLLAACATNGGDNSKVRITDGPGTTKVGETPHGPMSDGEIRSAFGGKTFQYTKPDGNGIATFAGDGTLEIQDDTKGSITGSWRANGGALCESYNPNPAMPDGKAESCQTINNTGDAIYAGKDRYVGA
jgi:hypothetical protein